MQPIKTQNKTKIDQIHYNLAFRFMICEAQTVEI